MALRNQPYFPLYVQDYLTDEKLNICSWKTQGVYIKILCILHKQKEYGKLLLKQNPKQNSSTCQEFAKHLIMLLPCQYEEMLEAIEELISNDVLQVDGLTLFQKRMVKDNALSEARSQAGSIGGKKTQFAKAKIKANDKANTEYEYENENENKDKDKGVKKFVRPSLEEVAAYCHERKNNVDPERWLNYYTANGFKVGKNQMKDWRAAVRTWEGNNRPPGNLSHLAQSAKIDSDY